MKFVFIALLTFVINISAFERKTLGDIVFKTKAPYDVTASADNLEKNKLASEAATKVLD